MQLSRRAAVLLVEDNEEIQHPLSWTLRDEGYEVRTASNGREALALLSDWLPDVVITDLDMPVLDGRGFLTEFRQRSTGARTPVIVYTGTRDLQALADELDADAVIAKTSWDDLLAAVGQFTNSSTPRAEDWTADQRCAPDAIIDWTSEPAAIAVRRTHKLDWTADTLGPLSPLPFTVKRLYGLVVLFPEGPPDPTTHARAA